MRNDCGQLWKNFVFVERLKRCTYKKFCGGRYFWRTYQGQEIDFIEEIENKLFAFEAKWSERKKTSAPPPPSWKEYYSASSFDVITPESYLEFVLCDNEMKRARCRLFKIYGRLFSLFTKSIEKFIEKTESNIKTNIQ